MQVGKKNLSRLLRPQSIVVFGGEWARNVVSQCRKMQFAGEVWMVHPHGKTADGARCFRTVAELPHAPDAAFVGINRESAVEVVASLANMGCGGAVCFASGFAESGASDLQNRLVAAAGDMPILGPNCYGFLNLLDGAPLWPDQHGAVRAQFGAAVIGQSSNILINISSQKRGLPLAYLIAAGNQAQTTIADIARGMLRDKRVRAIGFHIEGIADAADFAAFAADARAQNIPLVALKSGKCRTSRRAAESHTAALAGDAAASSAFLQKCGVAEVRDIPELIETLKLAMCGGGGRKLMSLSCSGGEAGHIADLADGCALSFPPPPAKQREEMAAILGELVHITNPLDYHTFIWRDEDSLFRVYSAALRCGNDLTILIYDYPRGDRCDVRDWRTPMRAFMRAVAATKSRAAVVATLPENMPEDIAAALFAAGIAPLCGLSESLAAIESSAVRESVFDSEWRPLPPASVSDVPPIDESEAKDFLRKIGINCPRGRRVFSAKEAGVVAAEMAAENPNLRFAVKISGVSHKTESGGVRLNLSPAQIESAAAEMSSDHFLVEEMIAGGVAEILIGVRRDEVYGATLTVGAGGTDAEWLADSQTMILPVSAHEVAAALQRLRCAPRLGGFRGGAIADTDAAVAAVMQIAAAISEFPKIAEIEINPLVVCETGAAAADALLRKVL